MPEASRIGGRLVLNETLAAEIYAHKLDILVPTSFESCLRTGHMRMKGKSAKLALRYGVSAKTIRDVWNRKTWADATAHLWINENSESISSALQASWRDVEFSIHAPNP